MSKMQHFNKIVGRAMKKSGIKDTIDQRRTIDYFYQMVEVMFGPDVRDFITITKFEEGIMGVASLKDDVANRLFDMRKEIVNGINAEMGKKKVYQLFILR